jgi:hypothetical protein
LFVFDLEVHLHAIGGGLEFDEDDFVLVLFEGAQHLVGTDKVDLALVFGLVESHSKALGFDGDETGVFESLAVEVEEGWSEFELFSGDA